MRALTLTQPWCGLVAGGIKLVENRPRSVIAREDFGRPFAIHASRVVDPTVFDRIYEIAPELRPALATTRELARWHQLARVTSAVIGIATVDHVLDPRAAGLGHWEEAASAPLALDQRRWYFGPVAYVLRDVAALAEPIPCRGWQGFWTLPDAVARAVAEQLEQLARGTAS